MNNTEDKQQAIRVSEEFEISYPAKRKGFFVDRREWGRLKKMVNNSISPTKWYDRLIGFCFGAVLSLVGFAISLPAYKSPFYVAAAGTFLLMVVFIIFEIRERRFLTYDKTQILDFISEMEIEEREDANSNRSSKAATGEVAEWTARQQPQYEQGVDFNEIKLSGRLAKALRFKVNSTSPYWRAGFKLVEPNAPESVPRLRTDKSFLFHIGRDENGKHGLWVYRDGKPTSGYKMLNLLDGQQISISFDRNSDNHISCYVNDSLEYNARLDPELFKKLYLVAWGDGRDYQVTFSQVAFNVE